MSFLREFARREMQRTPLILLSLFSPMKIITLSSRSPYSNKWIGFYGISPIVGYLKSNTLYTYILNT